MTLTADLTHPILEKILPPDSSPESPYKHEVINDFWLCLISRELSLQGRREVLTGKAKFGIFGDGKELPQVAMAKTVCKGDFRSGYYRDQTLMMALGISTIEDFLAQMYSDTRHDPFSGGRQMNSHFATRFIDKNGEWTDHINRFNVSAGVSCTGGQMGRALGLALASKKYRELKLGPEFDRFSRQGNEICFCTIGDASTSEGVFWETVNAAAVMKVPLVVAVWDDGYGISVPVEKQTVKGSISRALEGFLRDEENQGIDLYTAEGWDYQELCVTFDKAVKKVRSTFMPAVVHVKNLTQPQGHSTSGSHERYKSKARLSWETEYDCINKFEEWIVQNGLLEDAECQEMRREARSFVRERKKKAWHRFQGPKNDMRTRLIKMYKELTGPAINSQRSIELAQELADFVNPSRGEIIANAKALKFHLIAKRWKVPDNLTAFIEEQTKRLEKDYSTFLYDKGPGSALNIPVVQPAYDEDPPLINGYQVINRFFDHALAKYPNLIAFGEDVGFIGDVNQGMAGMQKKYGEERVFDTGIREWTIIGQGLGCAMRGLRPIAEIQYIDYLVYALPVITDDLATLRYRSINQQQAPLIIRTRGHRLEGIWHTGSPMGMLVNAAKGIYILTPRNMVQAAGMYNTMLQSNDPAIVIECLNGYRLKEPCPANIGTYTVPIGLPEILQDGKDATLVTYGSCVRIAMQALAMVEELGISVELIDAQTLIPFDLEKVILSSLKRTNKIIFLDEDHPGGATAYMKYMVLEKHGGYRYLDLPPVCVTAKDHRTPYGSDGDYYAKPQAADVATAIYELVFEKKLT